MNWTCFDFVLCFPWRAPSEIPVMVNSVPKNFFPEIIFFFSSTVYGVKESMGILTLGEIILAGFVLLWYDGVYVFLIASICKNKT